jgi:SAM-dependent methyltransferase
MPFEKDSRQKWRARLRRILLPPWLGLLRGTTPLSYNWGAERGTPVDRYYIEHFLAAHRSDIRGRVLEVAEDSYTRRFGSAVEQVDVLDIDRANPRATLFADLTQADLIKSNSFDCFVLTQTLHFIYNFRCALQEAHRILRPGGVLLASMPVVSRLCAESNLEDCWRFTPHACERLFGDVFGSANVQVASYGNVLAASAFLYGLAHEELTARELDTCDPLFPVVVCVRAIRP